MAETLLLHFNPRDPERATWSLVNALGELTSRITTGTLEQAREFAAGRKTVVLLDSRCLHLNIVRLPTSNRQKMLRAVPYALEEQIAEEIEDFHFVIGKQREAGMPVAGIRRSTLEGILERFHQASMRPDAMIADALCLPASADQWSVLMHEGRALVSFGNGMHTVVDSEHLPLLLQARLRETDTPPQRVVLFQPEGAPPLQLPQAEENAPETVQMTYNTHPLVVFCGHYANALPLNLLQDAYKPKRKHSDLVMRWRLPAALAASWVVLYLGSAAFEHHVLEQANARLALEIEQVYKTAFPQSKRIVNPRVQMEQKLNELRTGSGAGSSDFLTLLAESVDAISAQNDIAIESINYRNQRMNIGVTGSRLQSVESLNSALNRNPRLSSELSSATSENNKVKGSIRLQRNAS